MGSSARPHPDRGPPSGARGRAPCLRQCPSTESRAALCTVAPPSRGDQAALSVGRRRDLGSASAARRASLASCHLSRAPSPLLLRCPPPGLPSPCCPSHISPMAKALPAVCSPLSWLHCQLCAQDPSSHAGVTASISRPCPEHPPSRPPQSWSQQRRV